MRYLSLFSGIEAASAAWQELGWECVGVAEIERFPSKVLAHRHSDVPNLGDVTKITEADIRALGPIDLVVFGSPCQDLSVAGKRKGLDGARSGLFFDALRIVGYARPRWALWENVPGAFSSNAGADFGAVVNEMVGASVSVPPKGWGNEGCAVGSKGLLEWSTLDAQWFGVAQRRRRVFALADFGDWPNRPPILLEPEGLRGDSAPRRETREDVAGTLAAGSASSRDISHCLTTGGLGRIDAESETFVTHSLRGEGFDASEDGTGRGTPLVPVSVALRGREGGATAELGDDCAFALRASSGGGDKPYVLAFDTTQITSKTNRSNPQPGDPCHTLAKGADAPCIAFQSKASAQNSMNPCEIAPSLGVGKADGVAALVGLRVRRLTPRECERLQGFPDDHTAIAGAKDGPRYKALGNSMAAPVMRWIGQQIDFINAAFP